MDDPVEHFVKFRVAACLFITEFLKISSPEDLEIEEITVPRPVKSGVVNNEILVRFASVSDRDEVILHASNLKDCLSPVGVQLDILDHLQSDFKVLITYGNNARKHFGTDVKRSVRFFEEEFGLMLHLCLPSGKWIQVTPEEARVVSRHRRREKQRSLQHTLSQSTNSLGSPILSVEAVEKAWLLVSSPSPQSPSPLTGSNAVPLRSTSVRGERPKSPTSGPLPDEDVDVEENPRTEGMNF